MSAIFPYTALTRNIPTVSPPTTPPPRVSCGVKKVNRSSLGGLGIGQIVGGKISSPGAWPWQAAIMCKTCQAQDCGGTLVSAYHVVTSAHCVPTNNETFIKKYKVSDVKVLTWMTEAFLSRTPPLHGYTKARKKTLVPRARQYSYYTR